MPENEPPIEAADALDGRLPCERCGHEERRHTEDPDEEDGEVYCHVPDCDCKYFVSPVEG